MARQVLENGVILPAEYSDDWYDDMTSNLTKLDDVIGSDSEKLSSADVGAAALSNNYNDLDNLPTIPTVNDATLTIQKNGVDVQTFTANASSNVTCNITVPTKTSDLTNDSNFVDTSNSAVASGITSAKVTDYDAHIADTDIHVTTADKTKWNNQTYVFRYSSTALVASSTNSNTLLDNTDNLKVGDKVIDSSGVIYSVTAIDTVNSTFTIGTALIDLAQDSDVVHKSGDETISGFKAFSTSLKLTGYPDIRMYVSDDEWDVLPQTTRQSEIRFTDKNSVTVSYFVFQHRSDSNEPFRTCWRQQKLDGTSGYHGIAFNNLGDFYPENNNTINLGGSGNRWKSVYATNYYYGSNNVEFSNKFVTTDTAQTVSGAKTFSSDLYVANTDTTANTPNLSLRNYKADRGTTDTAVQTIMFSDKNAKALTLLESRRVSNGNTTTNILCYNTDASNNTVSGGIAIIKSSTETNFAPNSDNTVTCGRPLARWSKVYGIEYYYGNPSVEFSTKFVTTDTNQTISGGKTFSSNVNVYNSDNTADTPNIILKNSKAERGTEFTEQSINFVDKNNNALAKINCYGSSGTHTRLYITAYDSNNNSDGFFIRKSSTGTAILPTTSSAVGIGNSTLPYYNVQSNRFNGLEPSALGMPSGNANDVIDISSYITALDGTDNTYIAPANGWISIAVVGTAIAIVSSSWSDSRLRESSGNVRMLYPVLKNETLGISVTGTTLAYARFIPCQGNV